MSPPLAPTLMLQGTASSVGKSLLLAALCRIFRDEGLRVAPFKAQNMALNSAVTADGLEIGRAQAMQARAARIEPSVDMNPILLKPEAGMGAQLVLRGRAVGSVRFGQSAERPPELVSAVRQSLQALREQYELVLIEGAGSPAEINLKDRDLANGFVAQLADAAVLLVGDIDRGGVFASLYGTLALLDEQERARVRGLLINKFRGDRDMLTPSLPMLEGRLGRPILGVVPYIPSLRLPEEDSTHIATSERLPAARDLEVVVLALPHLSNFDDFLPLEAHPDLTVRYVDRVRDVLRADLLVLPGTKCTVHDLRWLRERRLDHAIRARAQMGMPVLGICGGCQMLGVRIDDPQRVESDNPLVQGLGLLPIQTEFGAAKRTERVRVRALQRSFVADEAAALEGYVMHMGRVRFSPECALFEGQGSNGERLLDGAQSEDGQIVGTLIHGLFDAPGRADALARRLRERSALLNPDFGAHAELLEDPYERLAALVRESVDMERLFEILGASPAELRKARA